jgi:uncharacterized protein DUF4145
MPNDITLAHCNRCGHLTNHHVLGEDRQPYQQEDSTWSNTYEMLKCCGCETTTMRNDFVGCDGVHVYTHYPPAVVRRAPDWVLSEGRGIEQIVDDAVIAVVGASDVKIPTLIRELMMEIYSAVLNDSLRLATIGIRTALENVMTEKVGDLDSFKAHVNAFQHAGYLSTRQALALDTIIEAGHASSHRGGNPVTIISRCYLIF